MEIHHPIENEDEIVARARANIASPEAEKQFLRSFLDKKEEEFNRHHTDKDERQLHRSLIDRARHNIEPLYREIEMMQAKVEEKFPQETIPYPVWMEKVQNEDNGAAYLKTPGGVETIIANPNIVFIPPKIAASLIAHEAGHDIEDRGYMLYTTQKQRECFGDHTAQYLGYGDQLKEFFEKTSTDLDALTQNHPTDRQRIAALSDMTFVNVSPADVTFDDECHMALKAPPPPPNKPKPRQK